MNVVAGAGVGVGAGSKIAARPPTPAATAPVTAKSIIECVRSQVSQGSALPASLRPLHLGAFGATGAGKSTLLNMMVCACGTRAPSGSGCGTGDVFSTEASTDSLNSSTLAAESGFDLSYLPLVFDCPGINTEEYALDYFSDELHNLFCGRYRAGDKLSYPTGITRSFRRTTSDPARGNMIDAFLYCVDVARFCSRTNITIHDEEVFVGAGTPLCLMCAQVRSLREKASTYTSLILVFTKWRKVDTYLRVERGCSKCVAVAVITCTALC